MVRTACSVLTDGSPAVGEVAFVTYNFTGPYELFRGTSVDIVGPSSGSALLPGVGDPSKVGNGQRFPFVIGGNMMWRDGFAVQTTLADGEIKTRCDVSSRRIAAPCRVVADDVRVAGQDVVVVADIAHL